MAKVNLSAPWDELYSQFEQMFKYDDDVRVVFDEEKKHIKLYVDDFDKAEALDDLLVAEHTFGNVKVKVSVMIANEDMDLDIETLRKAFTGNGAVNFIESTGGDFALPMTYVVFKNEVVQYFNDNLGDVNGNESTLFQNIAKTLFRPLVGVHYCTDVPRR